MKLMRYDLSNDCDGESGRCLEKLKEDPTGDYVLASEVENEIECLEYQIAEFKTKNEELSNRVKELDDAMSDIYNTAHLAVS